MKFIPNAPTDADFWGVPGVYDSKSRPRRVSVNRKETTLKAHAGRQPLLTIRQTAESTRFSVRTLYDMVEARRIPFVRLGRTIRFELRKLDEWIVQLSIMPRPGNPP